MSQPGNNSRAGPSNGANNNVLTLPDPRYLPITRFRLWDRLPLPTSLNWRSLYISKDWFDIDLNDLPPDVLAQTLSPVGGPGLVEILSNAKRAESDPSITADPKAIQILKMYRRLEEENAEDTVWRAEFGGWGPTTVEEERPLVMDFRRFRLQRGDGTAIGYDVNLGIFVAYASMMGCFVSPETDDLFLYNVKKVMRAFNLNQSSSTKLCAMISLSQDPYLQVYIIIHRRLRCFDILPFSQVEGRRFSTDLLVRLTWRREYISANDELGRLCRNFNDEARIGLARFMMKMVAIVCTTFVMLPPCNNAADRINMEDIHECLRLYPSKQWNTDDMPSQLKGSEFDLVDGFNLVSETLKVLIDDLDNHLAFHNQGARLINGSDLAQHIYSMIIIIFGEMFAYLYCRIHDKPTVEEFVLSVLPDASLILCSFMKRESLGDHENTRFPREVLEKAVTNVSNGQPTLGAELKFSAKTFRHSVNTVSYFPRNRLSYTIEQVNQRARFSDAPPREKEAGSHSQSDSWEYDVPLVFKSKEGAQPLNIHGRDNFRFRLPAKEIERQPAWLSHASYDPAQSHQLKDHDPIAQSIPETEENFVDDLPDSDNELDYMDDEHKRGHANYPELNIGDHLEEFYNEILEWVVHPSSKTEDGHINSTPSCNAAWISWYYRNRGKKILPIVHNANSTEEYMEHMKAFLILSVRAVIVNRLSCMEELEPMRTNPRQFTRDLYNRLEQPPFVSVRIDKASASRSLYHLEAVSSDPNFNNNMIESLMGLTLCVCYILSQPVGRRRERRKRSKVMFMVIRRAYFEGDQLEEQGTAADLDVVRLRLSVSKRVLKGQNFLPAPEQILFFYPITSLASELRIFRSIHQVKDLPKHMLDLIFGDNNVKVYYDEKKFLLPVSRSSLTADHLSLPPPSGNNDIRQMLEREIDPGCLEYVRTCLLNPNIHVDRSHFNALLQVLRVIGDGAPGTSGICGVRGPPGTGKTNNIVSLIGAIIHHSQYGHVGRDSINYRNVEDNILRSSRHHEAFKILVVASSNQAVDNILERLHDEGVPSLDGINRIYPSMLRVCRWNYAPKDQLLQYVVQNASRPYEESPDRNNPSLQARRRRADEAIIFLATCSTAGGSALKELQQWYDIVLHDEAAFSLETDTLVPLTATTTTLSNNRLYYFPVGDPAQLPALSHIKNMLETSKMIQYSPFDPDVLAISLFERLDNAKRITHCTLDTQYRMHPAISRITSVPFYQMYFSCPISSDFFKVAYNQPDLTDEAFYPMTFIDTSSITNRYEEDLGTGIYINETESIIACEIINRLYQLVPRQELDGQIAVITPYNSQVDRIINNIRSQVPLANSQAMMEARDIQVCTVDSMQGSQRNVIIYVNTRSNETGKVGFVSNSRRLNVSVTRARYLNIIIADFKTIKFKFDENRKKCRGTEELENIYHRCASREEPGSALAKAYENDDSNSNRNYDIVYQPVRNRQLTRSQTASSAITQSNINSLKLQQQSDIDFASLFQN